MRFEFGDHVLDEEAYELRRLNQLVAVQPKALALLFHLIRHRDRVVDKGELLDVVWTDERVTDASLLRAVKVARRAIGDSGRAPSMVVNVARRGYRFVAPVEVHDPALVTPGLEGRYIGRSALLEGLRSSLAQALQGNRRILLLSGEPGVGKTRTAEFLVQWARKAHAEVAGAWSSDSGSPTYWSWTRILRTLARAQPRALSALSPAQRRHLARILPEAASGSAPAPNLEGDVARFRLFEAVQSFLGRVAQERPTVLFFDDIHSADAESLSLLEFVGQATSSGPIVFVLTHRELQPMKSASQARALERLLRLSCVERWPITGLHGDDLADYVGAILGRHPEVALFEALERQTGGNPLLMAESLRALDARGMLVAARDRSEWEMLLPRGIEYLIDAKLRPLSRAARSTLAIISAVGIEVDADVLAECVPGEHALETILDELSESAILTRRVDSKRLRFSHVLIRNAVYEALVPTGSTRREVHARIATALSSPERIAEASLSERAHHACESAPIIDPKVGTALAEAAAIHAASLHDYEGAAAWYERALGTHELSQPIDSEVTATLCLGLGLTQIQASGLESARTALRRASQQARLAHRPNVFARAALAYADRPNSTGQPDSEVIALLEEAAARLPGEERALRIRVDSRLAAENRYVDRVSAEIQSAGAIVEARALDDPAVLAQALDDASFVLWSPTDTKAWIDLNAEAARLARTAGDERIELACAKGCVTGYLELNDLAGVDRAIHDCGRAADVLRTPNARWWTELLAATQDLLAGELEAAEGRILSSMRLAERASAPDVALEMPAQLVYLRLEQGRAREIEPAAREQTRRFPEQPAWRAAHARVLVSCGRTLEAADLLKSLAARGFRDVPRDRVWLGTHALAAEVAHACGNQLVAEELERILLPYAQLGVLLSSVLYYGPVAHYLGLAAATRADWDRAVGHLEAALAIENRFCAHLYAARTRVALARVFAARDATGDRPRALDLIREALAAAESKGLTEIAQSARVLESSIES